MRDVLHRPGEQFLLAVAQELAHRGIGAEEAGASGLDLNFAYAAEIEHGTECRFVLKTLPSPGELRAALFNALFQLPAKLLVTFDGKAHPGCEDHDGKCPQ